MRTESGEEDESEADTVEKIDELKRKGYTVEHITRENFLDGHKVDYVKKRVAFDWNGTAKIRRSTAICTPLRAFHECDLIDAAVLLTRSASLNAVFEKLGPELDASGKPRTDKEGKPKLIKTKYWGFSTTLDGQVTVPTKRRAAWRVPLIGARDNTLNSSQTGRLMKENTLNPAADLLASLAGRRFRIILGGSTLAISKSYRQDGSGTQAAKSLQHDGAR